jgi:hypothetical protein
MDIAASRYCGRLWDFPLVLCTGRRCNCQGVPSFGLALVKSSPLSDGSRPKQHNHDIRNVMEKPKSRKPHKKSRNGCLPCKARHVKVSWSTRPASFQYSFGSFDHSCCSAKRFRKSYACSLFSPQTSASKGDAQDRQAASERVQEE